MSLDTVLSQLGLSRPAPNSLEAQLHAMRRDVHRLARTLSLEAGRNAEDWGHHFLDAGNDVARHTAHLAGIASRQALRGARQVGRDPLPALAILGTGLLLARLMRRR
jgi:hypothetical protein